MKKTLLALLVAPLMLSAAPKDLVDLQVYPKDALPISEPGSRLDVQEDDGSEAFDRMYKSALDAPIKERKRT